jgi:hypothetical protein
MMGELLELARFVLGFLPWILFLFLPTDGWEPLRRAVVICLAASLVLTVLVGKPFTLQYARADLPRERWHDDSLIRGCQSIAIFWGALLLVPTALNLFQLSYPTALPNGFGFYLSLSCIAIGIGYTTLYKHQRRKQREAMGRAGGF